MSFAHKVYCQSSSGISILDNKLHENSVFFIPLDLADPESVNHLGHFQLTGLLWTALREAGGSRAVSVSSIGHRRMGLHLNDINFRNHPYSGMTAYGQSRTANIFFTVQLDKIGEPYGIRAFAVHPGAIGPEKAIELWKLSGEVTGVHFA